jgi:hypothetical protein
MVRIPLPIGNGNLHYRPAGSAGRIAAHPTSVAHPLRAAKVDAAELEIYPAIGDF